MIVEDAADYTGAACPRIVDNEVLNDQRNGGGY
jgi:hypothetical protein